MESPVALIRKMSLNENESESEEGLDEPSPPSRHHVNEPRMPPVLEDEVVDKRYYIRSSADEGNEEQLDHRRFRLLEVSWMLRISRIQKANRSWAIL
jgi:hypothetical protein